MINEASRFDSKLVVALSIALTACGGEGSGSPSAPSPEPIIPPVESDTIYYAQDVVRETVLTSKFDVDLSDSMESSDGSQVVLTDVIPLNAHDGCEVQSMGATSFTIDADGAKACDYRYIVGSPLVSRSTSTIGDGYSEATVRVVVGETTDQLPPLSGVTSSSTSVKIDLPFELGKLGYDIDTTVYSLSTTVNLPNDNTTYSSAVSDPIENTIEYMPGMGIPSGVERILFSYSDGLNILSGVLDIAVSQNGNNAPVAESKIVTTFTDPNSGDTLKAIPYGESMRFDVTDLISDSDGDTLHLTDVYSFGAKVSIPDDANGDGNYFNDTQFDFLSEQPGEASVTYVVSDGKGGYATGVVSSYVSSPYGSIVSGGLIFLPPLTHVRAVSAGISSTPQQGNGTTSLENVTTASHSWDTANNLCLAKGARLPTVAELQSLYNDGNTGGGVFVNHNWPVDLPYWTSNLGTGGSAYHRSIDLLNGTSNANDFNGNLRYVSCVDETPPGYPVIFFGNEVGDDYLFDVRINTNIGFGCGWIVDSMYQEGGAHIGGSGGSHYSISVESIGRIEAWWGPTGFGSASVDEMSRLKLYSTSGQLMLTCGDKDYSSQNYSSYTLSDSEVLTGFKAFGYNYLSGLELWIDTK